MKLLKCLFALIIAILVIPMAVFAEDVEATDDSSKVVNVYLFRGEGCPHCQEAEEWFDSIKDEYGGLFKIVDYETWQDEDNAKLMQQVAEVRGETAEGVPYIIIGDKSWNGFADDYKDEIIEQIKSVFEQDVIDRYDVMNYLEGSKKKSGNSSSKKSSSNDFGALVVILLVSGAVGFGVYKARCNAN